LIIFGFGEKLVYCVVGFGCNTNTFFLRGWECDGRSRAAKNNLSAQC
jgi:hypothetical protein